MFTNTPLLSREVKVLESVKSFSRDANVAQCSSILDELFFEWISNESSDDTTSEYRAKVAHSYRMMQKLLNDLNSNLAAEVSHD